MPDYRKLLDREYLYHYDLDGRDVNVTIRSIGVEEMASSDGKQSRKPVIYFEGLAKGLVMNSTNLDMVASMHGIMTENWIGKRITLYPTKDRKGGKNGTMVDCIRVRPTPPADRVGARPARSQPRPQALTALTGEKLKALVPDEQKGIEERAVRGKTRPCVTITLPAALAARIGRQAGAVTMIDLTEDQGKTLVLAYEELKIETEKTIADAGAALGAPGPEGTE